MVLINVGFNPWETFIRGCGTAFAIRTKTRARRAMEDGEQLLWGFIFLFFGHSRESNTHTHTPKACALWYGLSHPKGKEKMIWWEGGQKDRPRRRRRGRGSHWQMIARPFSHPQQDMHGVLFCFLSFMQLNESTQSRSFMCV